MATKRRSWRFVLTDSLQAHVVMRYGRSPEKCVEVSVGNGKVAFVKVGSKYFEPGSDLYESLITGMPSFDVLPYLWRWLQQTYTRLESEGRFE